MKTRTTFLLFLLCCWFAQPLVAAEPVGVSLIQLIANPKEYDGKVVRVIGFVRLALPPKIWTQFCGSERSRQ
jgi:hypothetical protein